MSIMVHAGDRGTLDGKCNNPSCWCQPYGRIEPVKSESQKRKEQPMYRGLLKYFPRALAAVAGHSFTANEKHNPGEELHWAREKSADHEDCCVRHLTDRAKGEVFDRDGLRHACSLAWRALAVLELELEAAEKAQTTSKS